MSIEAQCPAMTHAWKISWYLREPRGWGPGLCAWTASPPCGVCTPPATCALHWRTEGPRGIRTGTVLQGLGQAAPSRERARQGLARALHCPLLACEVGEARDMLR